MTTQTDPLTTAQTDPADHALAAAVRASKLIEAAIAWAVFNGPWDGEWETDHDLLDAIAAILAALEDKPEPSFFEQSMEAALTRQDVDD